ncbi:MAG TPA: DEAD/DEAH box helicase family protein [Mucilaginibacter sp.]|jgi:hypothetical protein|nr:DEAD/DEAH box helicase family protein [Mucilaginibacter sp.]
MLLLNNIPSIVSPIFDKECDFLESMDSFTDITELNPIPSDSIVFKTLAGIGATHSEIMAKRHSIIVLPYISVIGGKFDYYKHVVEGYNVLAVHEGVTIYHIGKYLNSDDDGYIKILTTPQGIDKIITTLEWLYPGFDYKNNIFLLIDECHKNIKDSNFRHDLIAVMDHFFSFTNKAMISATPIPPSDPRFKEQNFKHIKVNPKYDYKQKIELIHADSLVNAMKKYFQENVAEHYCIFFDSINGIQALINQLKLEDYHIYCSKNSANNLRVVDREDTSWKFTALWKYNFFTSSFFNGLDIIVDCKPNIIMLSDYKCGEHTLLDPYTDVLQIIGRVRRKDRKNKKDFPYNKVTHINNTRHFTNPITREQAIKNIEISRTVYEYINTLKQSLTEPVYDSHLEQALSTVKPYSKLLYKDSPNPYLIDNYIDEERVKSYYQSPATLRTAYINTGHFTVINKRECYEKSIRLQPINFRSSPAAIRLVADSLLEIEDLRLLAIYYETRKTIAQFSALAIEAFDRLGYEKMQELRFKKAPIKKELLKLDIEEGKNIFALIDLVHASFRLNTYYSVAEIKSKLQDIFSEFDVSGKAKATDVERYFDFKCKWKTIDDVRTRVYLFTATKLYPVNHKLSA